jgi:uncharacterized membrane protein YkoI
MRGLAAPKTLAGSSLAARCFLFCNLLLVSTASANSAEVRVQFKDLPPAVQKTAQEQSKGAVVRGYSKQVEKGKTYYEVETRLGGKNRDILLDGSGSVVQVEEQVDFASVPPAAMAALKKQASAGKLVSIECVMRGGNVFYEGVVLRGRHRREISVTKDGHPGAPE